MLNFAAHALEDFAHLDGPDEFVKPLQEIGRLLHAAVKFELPDNGQIVDWGKSADIVDDEILRLPFPTMALEYTFSDFHGLEGRVAIKKRISLCLDYETHKNSHFGEMSRVACPQIADLGGVILIPIYHFQDLWAPYIWGLAIPRTTNPEKMAGLAQFATQTDSLPAITRLGAAPIPLSLEIAAASSEELGGFKKTTETALADTAEEFLALLSLLAALSCSNISLEDRPAPAALNKKRLRQGKTLLFGYKGVVILDRPGKASYDGPIDPISERQSPREHLRRGHIRRYNDGNRIWIQSVIVSTGNGKTEQRYRIVKGS